MPTGVYVRSEEYLKKLKEIGKSYQFKKGHKVNSGRIGEKSGRWKGKDAGYYPKHQWVSTHYGKANKCENSNCVYPRMGDKRMMYKPKRFEYALIHGKEHDHKRENYISLCKSCHRLYDLNLIDIEV